MELQVRKSTADGEGARKYYEELTEPLEGWAGELRDLVIRKKQVRCDQVYFVFEASCGGKID